MKKIIAISLFALVLAVSVGGTAFAQTDPITAPGVGEPRLATTITSAQQFIEAIRILTDWLFVILTVIAVIFIVLAGLQFITGGGDPAAVSQARTKLIWAAVGILVALLARGLPAAISNLVEGG